MSGRNRKICSVGTCTTCGKQMYENRKSARRAAATIHPGEPLAVYRCGNAWHYGHAPRAVRRGVAPRRSAVS